MSKRIRAVPVLELGDVESIGIAALVKEGDIPPYSTRILPLDTFIEYLKRLDCFEVEQTHRKLIFNKISKNNAK